MARRVVLVALVAGLGLSPAAVSADDEVTADSLVDALVAQCVGFGAKFDACEGNQALGRGLVCPRPPVRREDGTFPADSGVETTTPSCPFRARGALKASILSFFETDAKIDIKVSVSGTKHVIDHDHVFAEEIRTRRCNDTYVAEEGELNVVVDAEAKAGAGNVARIEAKIEAGLSRRGARFCAVADHPGPVSCAPGATHGEERTTDGDGGEEMQR